MRNKKGVTFFKKKKKNCVFALFFILFFDGCCFFLCVWNLVQFLLCVVRAYVPEVAQTSITYSRSSINYHHARSTRKWGVRNAQTRRRRREM